MSIAVIVLLAVFSENVIFANVFETLALTRASRPVSDVLRNATVLAISTSVSTCALWVLRTFILSPLGFSDFSLFAYIMLVYPVFLFFGLPRTHGKKRHWIAASFADTGLSLLTAGIILQTFSHDLSLVESVFYAIMSSSGYVLSLILVDSIKRRLELEPVPAPFKGSPIVLISAGLIAMAFISLDRAFAFGMGL